MAWHCGRRCIDLRVGGRLSFNRTAKTRPSVAPFGTSRHPPMVPLGSADEKILFRRWKIIQFLGLQIETGLMAFCGFGVSGCLFLPPPSGWQNFAHGAMAWQ